jgi:hypothetical protein
MRQFSVKRGSYNEMRAIARVKREIAKSNFRQEQLSL